MRGYFDCVRRSCERPGCTEPVAVVYGYGTDAGDLHVWIDAWSPGSSEPEDASGIVCERHGVQLSAPKGWNLVDRRDVVPRLFVPRPVLVRSRSIVETSPDDHDVDASAARRRRRVVELGTPQLFVQMPDDVEHDGSHAATDSAEDPIAAPDDAAVSESSTRLDRDVDRSTALLEARTPLLRDAFGKGNIGRHDASKELMRPTTLHVVDESA